MFFLVVGSLPPVVRQKPSRGPSSTIVSMTGACLIWVPVPRNKTKTVFDLKHYVWKQNSRDSEHASQDYTSQPASLNYLNRSRFSKSYSNLEYGFRNRTLIRVGYKSYSNLEYGFRNRTLIRVGYKSYSNLEYGFRNRTLIRVGYKSYSNLEYGFFSVSKLEMDSLMRASWLLITPARFSKNTIESVQIISLNQKRAFWFVPKSGFNRFEARSCKACWDNRGSQL
jgi:hypothetical protein